MDGEMERRCYICGAVGFEELIATCMNCKSTFIHLYCMKTVQYVIPYDWLCEDCSETPEQGFLMDPKLFEYLLPESERILCRANFYNNYSIIKIIKKYLTGEEWKQILDSCLGPVARLGDSLPVHYTLMHYVISHELKTSFDNEMWFRLGGREYRFSLKEFGDVTGLNCGDGNDIEIPLVNPQNIVSINRASYELLLPKFKEEKDSKKKVMFALLLILEAVIVPKRHYISIDDEHIALVSDLDKFNRYPWGRLCYNELILSLMNINRTARDKDKIKIPKYRPGFNIFGYPIAFMVWILETFPSFKNVVHFACQSPKVTPYMSRWVCMSLGLVRYQSVCIAGRLIKGANEVVTRVYQSSNSDTDDFVLVSTQSVQKLNEEVKESAAVVEKESKQEQKKGKEIKQYLKRKVIVSMKKKTKARKKKAKELAKVFKRLKFQRDAKDVYEKAVKDNPKDDPVGESLKVDNSIVNDLAQIRDKIERPLSDVVVGLEEINEEDVVATKILSMAKEKAIPDTAPVLVKEGCFEELLKIKASIQSMYVDMLKIMKNIQGQVQRNEMLLVNLVERVSSVKRVLNVNDSECHKDDDDDLVVELKKF